MMTFKTLRSLGLLFLLYLTYGKPAIAFPSIVPYHSNDDASTYTSPAFGERDLDYDEGYNLNPLGKSYYSYTALGDGFAAGVGVGFTDLANETEQRCRRKQESYPYRLLSFKDILGINSFNFPACLADGPLEVKKQIEESGMSVSPLPRVWHNFGQPDLVSISVGMYERIGFQEHEVGQDEQDGILNQLVQNCYRGDVITEAGCGFAITEAQKLTVNNRDWYEDLIESALTFNLAQWQKRDVYVLGYPLWYNEKGSGNNSLCPEGAGTSNHTQIPWPRFDADGPNAFAFTLNHTENVFILMNDIIDRINKKVHEAVDIVNGRASSGHVYFVDVDQLFDGHRICDWGEPWFNVKSGTDLLLPTEDGYQMMANALVAAILTVPPEKVKELKTITPVAGPT